MSSCQYGHVHPPCLNPPSVSSSFPPGACITPSSETNSETISFLMVSPFVGLQLGDERVAGFSTHCGLRTELKVGSQQSAQLAGHSYDIGVLVAAPNAKSIRC